MMLRSGSFIHQCKLHRTGDEPLADEIERMSNPLWDRICYKSEHTIA